MSSKTTGKNKCRKPLDTTLGKAPQANDLSHLRKPIDTSIFGLEQVLQLMKTASDEVKRYVKYECDVMYECRVCRTIFRSLANFILHKRKYCPENYNPLDSFRHLESDLNVIRDGCESDEHESNTETEETKTNKNNEVLSPKCNKKLTNIVEKLLERHKGFRITQETLNEDLSTEPVQESENGKEVTNTLATESIESTDAAVFQTMFKNMVDEHKTSDLMKSQVMEIHDILDNDEAIIGEDGKVLERVTLKNNNRVANLQEKLTCSMCGLKFSTRKTLKYHVRYKHNNTRIVFPCPVCHDTFANAWGVFRHLCKVHRKTNAQIRKMRAQIHASGIRKDELPKRKDVESKGASEKCKENQWMDNIEGDKDFQMCGGCGKRFERKAALHSHSQICMKRIAICNSIKENNKKASAEESAKKSTRVSKRKQCLSKKTIRQSTPEVELPSDKPENDSDLQLNQDDVILIEDDEVESLSGKEEVEKTHTPPNETDATKSNHDILLPQDVVFNECSSILDLNHTNVVSDQNSNKTFKENNASQNNFTQLNVELKDILQKLSDVNSNNSNNNDKTDRGSIKRKGSPLLPDVTEEANNTILEEKMLDYVDKGNLKCLPCNLCFVSYKFLLTHMARHFNWFHYKCVECSSMFNDKDIILKHIEESHGDLKNVPESYIFYIPKWQTYGMITDFAEITSLETLGVINDLCDTTDSEVTPTKSDKTEIEESSLDCYNLERCLKSNNQEDLQKIVRQVILGENTDTSTDACETVKTHVRPDKQPEYNRPARNRVKSLDNDFVYDTIFTGNRSSKTGRVHREVQPTEKSMQFDKSKPVKTYTRRDLTKNRNSNENDNNKIIVICDDDDSK